MSKRKIIPAVILVIAVTAAVAYYDVIRKVNTSPDSIECSGTIEVTEIEVASKIAGRITVLSVEEGDRVKNGQPIIALAFDELEPQKISALASFQNAEKSFARSQQLYRTGSLSKQAYDNALAAYTTTKSQYNYILANISNTRLSSPIDGVVLRKNAERGELAFPGSPVVVLADIGKPWIKLYVPETRIGRIRIGNKVELYTDSFPDRKFPGKVIAISNKAEFTPKTIQTKEERVKLVFAVKVALENNDESLKPGMPADAVIFTGAEQ